MTIRKKCAQKMSRVITGYFYFLLKYMFHAGFVTFHNSQQKHNETSVEPPGCLTTLGKDGCLGRSVQGCMCVCEFLVAL